MRRAAEQFFAEDNIMNLDEVQPPVISTTPDESGSPRPGLRRTATGLSDILDDDNGDKPGGFALVIEGTALEHVSGFFCFFPGVLLTPLLVGTERVIQQTATPSAEFALRSRHLLPCFSFTEGRARPSYQGQLERLDFGHRGRC